MNTIFLVVILILLSLPAILPLFFRRVINPFSPPVLFSALVFMGYVLPIPEFLDGTDIFSFMWPSTYDDFEKAFSKALFQVVLGVLGFYIGYVLFSILIPSGVNPRQKPKSNFKTIWKLKSFKIIGIVYTFLGIGLFSVGVVLIGGPEILLTSLGDRIRLFAGLNYFFSAINLLPIFSLVWWAYLLKTKNLKSIPFWTYTFIAIMASSLGGAKSTIFVFVGCLTIMYHILYRPIKVFTIMLASGVLFFFLSIYEIFVREYLAIREFVSLDTTDLSFVSLLDLVIRAFKSNFMQLQVLTIIVDKTSMVIPYQNGKTLLSLFTIGVPSSIMPDKYITAPGVFTLALWPERWYFDGTTMPPGIVGEMYMNFGSAGVFFGMVVFGSIYGYIYAKIIQKNVALVWVVLYSLLTALMAHYVRGEVTSPTVLLLIFIIPTILALRFVLSESYRWQKMPPKGSN